MKFIKGAVQWLRGKKTNIVAIVGAALAVADALQYPVPPEVYAVLIALGLYTVRDGMKTETKKTVAEVHNATVAAVEAVNSAEKLRADLIKTGTGERR